MLRRAARVATLAGAGSFLVVLAAVLLLLAASAAAPPPVERRPMDYDAPPAAVVADAIHNLGAAEYTYDLSVVESGGRVVGPGPQTTIVQHVEVDNGARRYRGTIAIPVLYEEDGETPRGRFYAESITGYLYTPAALGGGWSRNPHLGYAQLRNAFVGTPPRDASATVVAENETTYVARITDPAVAVDVAYPGFPDFLSQFGRTIPSTSNATANLTVTVDKRTGHVTRAVLRYWNPDTSVHPAERDRPRAIRATYEFSRYGATAVGRPLATLPPRPRAVLYRLDLGVWALASGGWGRLAMAAVRLLVGSLAVGLVVTHGRRVAADSYHAGAGAADRLRGSDVVASRLPDVARRLPDVASRLPDVASRLPDVASRLPDVAGNVPDIVAPRVRAASDVDWRGYARFVARGYLAVLSVLWLVVAAAFVAGLAVGPAPGPDPADAPAVDPDGPPAEAVADAVEQLRYRDYTAGYWFRRRNRTDGSLRGGIAARFRVQHSAGRIRMRIYPSVFDEGLTEPSDPHYAFYGTRVVRYRGVGPDGAWRRVVRSGYLYRRDFQPRSLDAGTFRGANATVRADNRTALVVEMTDPDVVHAVERTHNATDERVVVVVARRPSPHLVRVAYRGVTDDAVVRWTYRYSSAGSTVVERPERASPAPVTGAVHRAGEGLSRIVGWLR